MSRLDGYAFWRNVDELLDSLNITYKDLARLTGIEYRAFTSQKSRHSIPKAEQLLEMAAFFNVSVDALLKSDNDESPQSKRIERIRRACLIASEEDLKLVERILRIDSARSPKQFTFSDSAKI